MKDDTIFGYIISQEAAYKQTIPLTDVWNWSMWEHIKTSFAYIHSRYADGMSQDMRPFKNIIRPILNLQHRTEDIELKDVQLYVDDSEKYHLSFLVKKYHDDVFVIENDLDTFFDELNVSRIDYGGGLSKKLAKGREVVQLQSIVFCDQTDILSGPIGIKHYYSPDQLLEMEKVGWGDESNGATASLQDVIELSREEKKEHNGQVIKTPGKYIEVYEIHGTVPKKYADPSDSSDLYETRIFITCFYQKKDSLGKGGIILYTALEKESPFKLIKRDPVYGRALGFGGAEELFESQVWTNYDMIRKQDMKDAASKTILKASGAGGAEIAQKSKIRDMDNLNIIDVGVDGDLSVVDTFPRNMQLFDKSVEEWEAHAQQMGAANDSLMGASPASGTPFKLQELVTNESRGLHEYRRGQYAKHIEEIYTDDYIPQIIKEITKGAKFLSVLSLEELQYVTEAVVRNQTNQRVKEMVLAGELPTQEAIDLLKEVIRDNFKKKGMKHFIEIIKGEFKDVPLAVKVSVAGKSKDLSQRVDKLVNVMRQILVAPQMLQDPVMGGLFNQIIEASGLEQVDFSQMKAIPPPVAQSSPLQPEQPVAQPV